MKIGYIILCRYNSTRLPGKILKPICGEPILSILMNRLKALGKQNIIVATSNEQSDDIIADYCLTTRINLYRGNLNNVAERFLKCAHEYKLDYAVRINGDNLFADANLIEELVSLAFKNNLDFVSNVPERTFPTGMSIEVVKVEAYQRTYQQFKQDKNYCEHVTLFLYEHPHAIGKYFYYKNHILPEANGKKMAIDTLEDFKEAEKIIEMLDGDKYSADWKTIITIKQQLNEQLEG